MGFSATYVAEFGHVYLANSAPVKDLRGYDNLSRNSFYVTNGTMRCLPEPESRRAGQDPRPPQPEPLTTISSCDMSYVMSQLCHSFVFIHDQPDILPFRFMLYDFDFYFMGQPLYRIPQKRFRKSSFHRAAYVTHAGVDAIALRLSTRPGLCSSFVFFLRTKVDDFLCAHIET